MRVMLVLALLVSVFRSNVMRAFAHVLSIAKLFPIRDACFCFAFFGSV